MSAEVTLDDLAADDDHDDIISLNECEVALRGKP
jgi:hypothetical protein